MCVCFKNLQLQKYIWGSCIFAQMCLLVRRDWWLTETFFGGGGVEYRLARNFVYLLSYPGTWCGLLAGKGMVDKYLCCRELHEWQHSRTVHWNPLLLLREDRACWRQESVLIWCLSLQSNRQSAPSATMNWGCICGGKAVVSQQRHFYCVKTGNSLVGAHSAHWNICNACKTKMAIQLCLNCLQWTCFDKQVFLSPRSSTSKPKVSSLPPEPQCETRGCTKVDCWSCTFQRTRHVQDFLQIWIHNELNWSVWWIFSTQHSSQKLKRKESTFQFCARIISGLASWGHIVSMVHPASMCLPWKSSHCVHSVGKVCSVH